VVSNRLPVVLENAEDGIEIRSGSGGLVTALAPIVKKNKGAWIGWPGCEITKDILIIIESYNKEHAINLQSVLVTAEEESKYYRGFSNESIWPLFHDLLGHCRFEMEDWDVYCRINRRFAEKIMESLQPGDFIWIHDYQLLMVGHYLRLLKVNHPLAHFLHIPFPTYDLLRRLPWKEEIIHGLLEYDLIGFQTIRDKRNFLRSAKDLRPELEITSRKRSSDVKFGSRSIKVGNFPISIDFEEFNNAARKPEVACEAKKLKSICNAKQLLLGIDRLDYTKGIPERLMAFERALEKYPSLRGNLSLLQLIVPSRSKLMAYQNLKEDLDGMVGRINGRFSKFGWQPVQYMYRSVSRTELLGFYRACEIGFVTPLRDGMNLVAKEFCASTVDNNGVLILSEFAGAAEQLSKGALMVNPYNREETADAIYQAFRMDLKERHKRMAILRSEVKRNDIHKWVDWFLGEFKSWQLEKPLDLTESILELSRKSRIETPQLVTNDQD